MNTHTQQIMQEGQNIVDRFLDGRKFSMSDFKPSDLPDKTPGVYAIFNSTETLYVGRTKNLRQRLYTNHLMGQETNARLKKYLIEDKRFHEIKGPEDAKAYLKEHCYFQFIEVEKIIDRGRIEGLLSYALNVKYMHEEH